MAVFQNSHNRFRFSNLQSMNIHQITIIIVYSITPWDPLQAIFEQFKNILQKFYIDKTEVIIKFEVKRVMIEWNLLL